MVSNSDLNTIVGGKTPKQMLGTLWSPLYCGLLHHEGLVPPVMYKVLI